jgi:hypothetical protein
METVIEESIKPVIQEGTETINIAMNRGGYVSDRYRGVYRASNICRHRSDYEASNIGLY